MRTVMTTIMIDILPWGPDVSLDATEQLHARPMGRLLAALRAEGASIDPPGSNRLPFPSLEPYTAQGTGSTTRT
jgi:5-enolpyruvylshikimate-3-phosphate synthase